MTRLFSRSLGETLFIPVLIGAAGVTLLLPLLHLALEYTLASSPDETSEEESSP
jgi:hypothetical protein